MQVSPDSTSPLGPLDRAIELLFLLADESPMPLAALARRANLPKSTVHRLAGQLEAHALVERSDGGYLLGPACLRLARGRVASDSLVAAAESTVVELSRSLGETLFLVAARHGELVVLHKHEGSGLLRASPDLGSKVPVHATAAGRLYLAFAEDQVGKPRGRLAGFTERTPTDRDELERRVEFARERGFDANVGEWIEGLAVLGAAIRTSDGTMHGVLTLALTEHRFQSLGETNLAARLMTAATAIAARLEGRKR